MCLIYPPVIVPVSWMKSQLIQSVNMGGVFSSLRKPLLIKPYNALSSFNHNAWHRTTQKQQVIV